MTLDVGQGLLNALIFMGPLAVVGGLICMYFWDRTARSKIKVLLVKTAGGTSTYYVNKEGNEVTITNPATKWSGTWPINSLATIPQPYPDLAGILPRFLQREIQLAIVIEGDIEPLLNRSAHRANVASPNVVNALKEARLLLVAGAGENESKENKELIEDIDYILANTVTGPTRELIASPDWVSALRKSTALKALASVSDELLDSLKKINNQLARFAGLNSTYVYLGLGLIIVLLGFTLYYTIQAGASAEITDTANLSRKIDAISNALGIK